ncbi:DUF736 domain-containing protein [Beijerinckia mobilis]|uniref:DUF736 domain-containing protein n=1 Tax=Beijerinckia mobilis TaxID=231434 RepID=UPI00068EF506|nr:DUF736 domain-containing protein [Beijerinckia mobilis]
MSVIGSFSYDKPSDTFTGRVTILKGIFQAKLVPNVKRTTGEAPFYRVKARNGADLGAAWVKFRQDDKEPYLSLKLDDPSFPAPIFANLVEIEGEPDFQLIWSRPSTN